MKKTYSYLWSMCSTSRCTTYKGVLQNVTSIDRKEDKWHRFRNRMSHVELKSISNSLLRNPVVEITPEQDYKSKYAYSKSQRDKFPQNKQLSCWNLPNIFIRGSDMKAVRSERGRSRFGDVLRENLIKMKSKVTQPFPTSSLV